VNRPPEESEKCEAISDDLIEFALGTLTGRSRSLVLDHLETCAHCDAELEALTAATDTMLFLAPESEPPLGFETRLIERYRRSDTRRSSDRWRRASVWAIAAVLVAVLGVGVDTLVTTNGGSNQPSALRPTTGRLMSSGHTVGQVTISSGSPSWLIMNVDAGAISGVVWCEVTLTNGEVKSIGKFTLNHGYGSWVSRIDATGGQVRSARLVNAHGTVIAKATFAA
jgi:Putative zinc-finger